MNTRLAISIFCFSLLLIKSEIAYTQYSIIQDIRSGSPSSDPGDFAIYENVLYFAANDGTNGKELWKYDGVNAPSMVADIRTGSSSSSPSNLMVFNDKLHFLANNGSTGTEIWEYDGVSAPSIVADIATGTANGVRYEFVEYNNKLYFEALDFTNGYALWVYDGVNAPSLVSDIYSGPFYEGTGVSDLVVFNGKLYFAADDETVGYELWEYDGTNPPTLVQDIFSGGDGSFPDGLCVYNNKLHFNADDDTNGYELWEYDGTNAPSLVANISAGSSDAFPKNFMEFQGKLYFNADDGSNGQELWEYDGTNTPTLVADIRSGNADANPDELTVYNGQLYFRANDGSNGIELWSYDGINPPAMVDDLFTGALNGNPDDIIVFDGKLIMEASNGSTGFEIWSYSASCSCSSTSPIPTAIGTYNSSCSDVDGLWRHYCDSGGNLLLSLNIGSSGAVVNDDEVTLKIEGVSASFHDYECGATPACFVDLPDGIITFNRSWDVSPTTQPSTGNVGVKYYFSQSEYNAVNTEISSQGQTELTSMDQLWFYKVTNSGLGQFPAIDFITPDDVQIITNNPSTASASQWVLSTKNAGSEFVAEFEVTSFSGGGGGGAGAGAAPLPVELLYFEANSFGDYDIELKWATASELNNDRFEIYKSLDGERWRLFEIVEGSGNSTAIQNYTLLDENPYWGMNYYKLVQVDFDGRSESFGIKSVDLSGNKNTNIKVFPNPVENTINVVDVKGDALIYDCSGYLILQSTLDTEMNTIDLSSIRSGVYQLVIIQENGSRVVQRFVKKTL